MDRKFWPKHPENGFSVRKNNFIIKDTMRKHDLNIKRKNAIFADKLGERANAVASYLASSGGANRSRTVEDYFGKIYHAHLKGEDIRNKLFQQQQRTIKTKKAKYEQEEARKLIAKTVIAGKGTKLRRSDAKKEQKSSKKV